MTCPSTGAVGAPQCECGTPGVGARQAWIVPYTIAAAQPSSSAHRWNQRVYRPATIDGNVCRIQMPPSNCRLIENVLGRASTKTRAPALTMSETNCATLVCSAGLAFG